MNTENLMAKARQAAVSARGCWIPEIRTDHVTAPITPCLMRLVLCSGIPWILGDFDHPVTNAYTESLNDLIRVMNRGWLRVQLRGATGQDSVQ